MFVKYYIPKLAYSGTIDYQITKSKKLHLTKLCTIILKYNLIVICECKHNYNTSQTIINL